MIAFTKSTICQLVALSLLFIGCSERKNTTENNPKNKSTNTQQQKAQPLSETFKSYWFAGKAELTSYTLSQARYGEVHEGKAVLIYVTEDFNPEKQVKADQKSVETVPVLKLNATKKFTTGIYPYSIMSSTFYPLTNNQHAIKVSTSIQEWCGHVFMQLNNREDFEVQSFSYFEKESDQELSVSKTTLEDELWAQLRLDPTKIPQGNLQIIPSFEYIRLRHQPIQAVNAVATLTNTDNTYVYELQYPEFQRNICITLDRKFPHTVIGWTETIGSGNTIQITKAEKLQTLITPYWSKNSVKDSILRNELGL